MHRAGPLTRLVVLVFAANSLLDGCAPERDGTVLTASPEAPRAPAAAAGQVAAGNTARVLMILDPESVVRVPRSDRLLTPDLHAQRVLQFAAAKKALLAGAPAGVTLQADYDQLPIALVDISSRAAWDYLVADPRVLRLAEDEVFTASLDSSLKFIRQAQAAAEGKDGTGASVAVLDTGADYTLPALGSCTAPGTPASCRVPVALDFAPQDNMLDDSVRHGTNVSAIVAGVAPGAKIIPLDVFTGSGASSTNIVSAINWVIANKATYNIAAINMSLGSSGYTAPCPTLTMSVAVDEARKAGILSAVATGNSSYINGISQPACAPAAVSVGAVHDGSTPPSAADEVAYFSNSASFMTLLAPGVNITAGGITMSGTSQATPHVAGAIAVLRAAFPLETADELVARLTTSGVKVTDSRNGITKPRLDLASAAAGCVLNVSPTSKVLTEDEQQFDLAVTTSAACSWTAKSDNAGYTLLSGGSGSGPGTITVRAASSPGEDRLGSITVTGSGASDRVVSVKQEADRTPPTGSIQVNAGAAYTTSGAVTLTLTGSDVHGVSSMCLSNTGSCTDFVPFATSAAWTLEPREGLQTVSAWLKDGRGNVSAGLPDTITLDTVAPTNGVLSATASTVNAALKWTAGTDATSGVARYRVVYASGAPPASCAEGTLLYEGSDLLTTHAQMAAATAYGYRLCTVDNAGNVSSGTTATATLLPEPDKAAPTGTAVLNGGAAYTTRTAATLSINATDASAITGMCVSATATCPKTAWTGFTASLPFTLSPAQGLKRVSVWLKDEWGNTTATPLVATLTLDTVAPRGGTLTSVPGNLSNSLTWTAPNDTWSGVASYRLVYSAGAAPADCTSGMQAYEGPALAFTHQGLVNGTTYGYRLCATDGAGNINAGITVTSMPRPESAAPTGTVTLNGGAAYATSTALTVSVNATDASAITGMCTSTSTTCPSGNWTTFAASSSFTISATQGLRQVNVWLRDEWGNTTAAPLSGSITLDTAGPTGATLMASGGKGQVALSWTAATDAGAGLQNYRLVQQAGTTPPASKCSTGTLVYEGTNATFTAAGLPAATSYAYRLCPVDKLGNVGAGATAVAKTLR